jgi:hypothetical protein
MVSSSNDLPNPTEPVMKTTTLSYCILTSPELIIYEWVGKALLAGHVHYNVMGLSVAHPVAD